MIEVKTIHSEALLRKHGTAQNKSKMNIFLVVGIVLVLAGIILMFIDSLGIWYGLPFVAAGILIPLAFMLISRAVLNRKIASSQLIKHNATQIFRFGGDRVMVNQSSKYTQAQDTQFAYEQITKAVEWDDLFCLYVDGQTYILDAKGFRIGARRDLHNLLSDTLGGRFKCKTRIYAKK